MTSNKQYWIKRADARMDDYSLAAFDVARVIGRSYNSLLKYIQSEMIKILRHIGDEDSLAYEYRMRRLAALLKNTEKSMEELYGLNLTTTTDFLKEIVSEAYYHTIFDIAQGTGVQPEFSAIPQKLVDKILNEDWSGKNYSERIWQNTEDLAEEVRELLTEAAISGESIYKTSRKLAEKFDQSEYNARRLIQTETVYACNQAELESYKDLDIDKYLYIATFDTRTCEVCQKNDQKIFNRKDAVAGVNLAPMHPNCHCRTIPYFKEGMPTKKIARDKDGNNITIPMNMKYDDWYKKYIGEKKTGNKRVAVVPKGNSVEVEVSKPEKGGYTEVKIPKK